MEETMFDAGRPPFRASFLLVGGGGDDYRLWADGYRSGTCSPEWTGEYHDRGYSFSGGRGHSPGESDHHVAGVCNRERDGGGWRHDERDAGSERRAERGAGAECECDSGGRVLHGGVPAWTGPSKNEYWVVPTTSPANLAG